MYRACRFDFSIRTNEALNTTVAPFQCTQLCWHSTLSSIFEVHCVYVSTPDVRMCHNALQCSARNPQMRCWQNQWVTYSFRYSAITYVHSYYVLSWWVCLSVFTNECFLNYSCCHFILYYVYATWCALCYSRGVRASFAERKLKHLYKSLVHSTDLVLPSLSDPVDYKKGSPVSARDK